MRPRTQKEDSGAWKALCAKAQVVKTLPTGDQTQYVLHEARHTTASLLLAAGVDPAIRHAILGHASAASAAVYEHVDIESARIALANLEATLQLTR